MQPDTMHMYRLCILRSCPRGGHGGMFMQRSQRAGEGTPHTRLGSASARAQPRRATCSRLSDDQLCAAPTQLAPTQLRCFRSLRLIPRGVLLLVKAWGEHALRQSRAAAVGRTCVTPEEAAGCARAAAGEGGRGEGTAARGRRAVQLTLMIVTLATFH